MKMFFRKKLKHMTSKKLTELLKLILENDKLMVDVLRGIMERLDRLEQNEK